MIIYAKYRKNIGTGNSRKLRIKKQLPAIIYGKNKENIPIILDENIFDNTEIKKNNKIAISIIINKTKYIVKIHDIQYHPFKKKIIHIDFIHHIPNTTISDTTIKNINKNDNTKKEKTHK